MSRKSLTLFRIGAYLSFACWLAVPGFAQLLSERSEFWPEVDAYVKLNQRSRAVFLYNSSRTDDLENRQNWQVGGAVDFYFLRLVDQLERQHPDTARSRALMIRAGYYFYLVTPTGATKPAAQHIPIILGDTRFSLPWKMRLAERNRFDLRIVNGDFRPRYRNRVTIERPFKTGRFEIAPYIQGEATYDWNSSSFNRFSFSTGADWTIVKSVVLESYYTRQHNIRSVPEYVNALGVTLQLHLR